MKGKITGSGDMQKCRSLITSKEWKVSSPVKISKRKTYSFILVYIMPRHGHVWGG